MTSVTLSNHQKTSLQKKYGIDVNYFSFFYQNVLDKSLFYTILTLYIQISGYGGRMGLDIYISRVTGSNEAVIVHMGSVTSKYRQVGNAVPVSLAKDIGIKIVEMLKEMGQ